MQLMTTLDKRFMAGLAYFLGIRKLGASVIRVGNGMPELQWDTISRLRPDTLMCVPSFILRLIDYAEQHGIDYRASSVRRIIGIGEGLREQGRVSVRNGMWSFSPLTPRPKWGPPSRSVHAVAAAMCIQSSSSSR